jgi:hypothetical protein
MSIQYFRGLNTGFDFNTAPEAWEGGGGSVPAGRYKAMIVGVGAESKITKPHMMVTLKILEAYDEENKAAVSMEINDIFALTGEKNPQNYFRGLYKTVAPWAEAPQFIVINQQTQAKNAPLEWLVGDAGQPGAIVNVTIIREERQTTNEQTGATEMREFSKVQRGYELVEPSSFAKRVLQQAGLNPAVLEVPANTPPQQHLMPQQVQPDNRGNGAQAAAGAQTPGAGGGLNPQA